MIKIIKRGKSKSIKTSCRICGCVFKCDKEDIVWRGSVRTIKCPQCEKVIIVNNGYQY